tara:strand:+ start:761 stop:889 length:129 start_codon:yes stop_codon:yes gene_type:complete
MLARILSSSSLELLLLRALAVGKNAKAVIGGTVSKVSAIGAK